MTRPTSIVDNPLVRQAPISGLLALSAFLSVVMPTLAITQHHLFVASVVGVVVATLMSAIPALVRRAAWVVPVLLTVDFLTIALLHLLLGAGGTSLGGFQVFVTTFLLGLLTGMLVAMTDRIGGAILAHVLFNAVAVVATWPR